MTQDEAKSYIGKTVYCVHWETDSKPRLLERTVASIKPGFVFGTYRLVDGDGKQVHSFYNSRAEAIDRIIQSAERRVQDAEDAVKDAEDAVKDALSDLQAARAGRDRVRHAWVASEYGSKEPK